MTMFFNQNLHSEGWWDHMPPSHRIDIPMGANALPSSRGEAVARPMKSALRPSARPAFRPTTVIMTDEPVVQANTVVSSPPRRIRRSHASAWILLAAVTATGGALAVANMRDPGTLGEHLDAAIAEVKSITGSPSSNTATTTAQSTAPAADSGTAPVAGDPAAPVTTAQATVPDPSLSSDTPLAPITPAAGKSVIHPTPDVVAAAPVVKQAEPPKQHLATLAPSAVQEMPLSEPPRMIPPPAPAAQQQLTPVQPPPVVTPPVVTPPVVLPPPVQPPMEVVPPVVQPPASSPPQ